MHSLGMLASTPAAEPDDHQSSGLFIAIIMWKRRALLVVPSSRLTSAHETATCAPPAPHGCRDGSLEAAQRRCRIHQLVRLHGIQRGLSLRMLCCSTSDH